MEKGARTWFRNLPPSSISSFRDFLVVFKESWVKDEDKDLIGNPVDAFLWVELCNHKSSIVKGKQQEHYSNPSRFPHIEVKAHEDALLYWITYAWKKCDLLGLDDQKEILNTIIEEVGFKLDD